MVKGTKVIRATLFVISMEVKKHILVRARHNALAFLKRGIRLMARALKSPMLFRPDMVNIRQNSRERVRKSI